MTREPNEFDDLPKRLAADLRTAYSHDVHVPEAVDSRVLNNARVGFAKRSRFWSGLFYSGFAAAAAVLIFGIVLPEIYPAVEHVRPHKVGTQMLNVIPSAAEDVDHNGKVDILDAFVVAKLVETGKKVDEAYDVNGDGKVDQADVDRIAHAAVAVAPHSGNQGRPQ